MLGDSPGCVGVQGARGDCPPAAKPTHRHPQPGPPQSGRAGAQGTRPSWKIPLKPPKRKQQRGFLRKGKGKAAVRWWHLLLGAAEAVPGWPGREVTQWKHSGSLLTPTPGDRRDRKELIPGCCGRDLPFAAAVFCVCSFPYGNASSL